MGRPDFCSRHRVGWRTVACVYAALNTPSKSKFLTSYPPASPPSPDHNRFFGGDQAKLWSALAGGGAPRLILSLFADLLPVKSPDACCGQILSRAATLTSLLVIFD